MRIVLLTTLLGLSSVCPGRAHAETPRRVAKMTPDLGRSASDIPYEALVGQADSDGDERVTAAELAKFVLRHIQRRVAARFERLDRNHDGVVARNEVPTMNAARFARFDLDGDQRLVRPELERALVPLALERCHRAFSRLDRDRDGAISANERDASDERQALRER